MKLLYDATVLASGVRNNAHRSGLFVVGREVLRELLMHPELEIDLCCVPSKAADARRAVAVLIPEFSGKFICPEQSSLPGRIQAWFETRKPAGKFSKLFFRSGVVCFKALSYLTDRFLQDRVLSLQLKHYDAYFSPVYLAPGSVRRSPLRRFTIVHDTIPKLYPQYSIFSTLGLSWTFDLLRNLNENDFCFANSECTKKDFLRFSPRLKEENVTVIPLAANESFRPCTDESTIQTVCRKYNIPDKPYFLSLCTIDPRKNLIFALRAFAQYVKEAPRSDAVFVLAGGHWVRFESQWNAALAELAPIRERIILPGYIDDEDLAPLYSGASLFVYPSLYEGFGLPPLEAMQCGCPVLVSNTSSLPEVVADAGIQIAPDDTDSAVAAMHRVMTDPEYRAGLSGKALERAKLFSWKKCAEVITEKMKESLNAE